MPLLLEPNSTDTLDEPEESQNHEDDLESLAWRNIEIDETKPEAAALKVIKRFVNSADNLPDQIIEASKAVLKTSSGINKLQDHKEDFEKIIGRASILVIALWQSYKKKDHSRVWPTPKLRIVVDYFIETVQRIHKLLKRKSKNFAKRFFKAYVVRDLGKFKKYEERLDSIAEDLEKLSNIKTNEVMLEIFDSQAQYHDDEDAELSEQSARGDSFDMEDTQTRAAIQELSAEGSNSQHKGNGATKPSNWKMKSEEENEVNQTKSKALEKFKNKVNNDSEAPYFKDTRRIESKGKKQKKITTVDEDVEEGTSGKGFGTNSTTKAKKRLSHDEERTDTGNDSEDVPVITTKKKKPTKTRTSKQNARRQTAPPQLAVPTSGVYINNGSGTVVSRDTGNITNSIVSNVGNNNSRNYYRSKST